MRVGVGIAALAALVALVLPHGRTAEPTKEELFAAFEKKLKAVSESAGPSVACVVVSRSDAYPRPEASPSRPGQFGGFDPREFLKADPSPARAELARRLDLSDPQAVADHGSGGGVVIDPAGLVLTNYHTIEDATKVYVHLPGGKGSYADVHAADKRSDLAVLKLLAPPKDLRPIKFADVRTVDGTDGRRATVYPTKLVVLLAHPAVTGFGVERPSAGFGSLSSVRRRVAPPGKAGDGDQRGQTVYDFGTFLEYDTRPAIGGSGGALLNLDGELIGLTTALVAVTGAEAGPGYALPMDANTRRIVEVLRRGEEVEYGFLGVQYQDVAGGVLISVLTTQGPAQLAGLRAHDVITQVDDVPVADRRDLFLTIGTALAGNRVKVTTRDRPRPVEVTLGKYQHALPHIASVRPDPVFGLRVEYTSVLFQQPGRAAVEAVLPGVIVRELVPDSPAAAKFKALGDPGRWLITHVDATAVATPAEFYKAAKGRQSVKLTLGDLHDLTARPRELTLP